MNIKVMFTLIAIVLALITSSPLLYGLIFETQKVSENIVTPTYLLFKQNESTIEFRVTEILTIDSKTFAKVVKTFRGKTTEYYVEIPSRKIYYNLGNGVLGFSGIYTILWFNKKPVNGTEIPLLDFYGIVVNVDETGFTVLDYYGDSLYYAEVNGIFVLKTYNGLVLDKVIVSSPRESMNLNIAALALIFTYAILSLGFYLLYKIYMFRREVLSVE